MADVDASLSVPSGPELMDVLGLGPPLPGGAQVSRSRLRQTYPEIFRRALAEADKGPHLHDRRQRHG